MEDQKFDLNKYRETITRLSSLIKNEKYKDVTFVFDGCDTKIKAHKCILEAASPVFEAMFSGDYKEKDEVKIDDIKPEVFQLLLDGIYLKEVKFDTKNIDDAINVADLYYAAEKYDIQDLRQIAKDSMISMVHDGNTHFLLKKALLFDLPDLKAACEEYFKTNTYHVLGAHLVFNVADDSMFIFFALGNLAILHEYELYVALEVMVQNGKLKSYSKCLSKIRFLTMTSREVITCELLSAADKVAVIANIEANLHNEEPFLPLPSHLSATTKKRLQMKFEQWDRQHFWAELMLKSLHYQKYFKQFMKYMSVPADRKEITHSLIKTARNELKIDGSNEGEIFSNVITNIFSF